MHTPLAVEELSDAEKQRLLDLWVTLQTQAASHSGGMVSSPEYRAILRLESSLVLHGLLSPLSRRPYTPGPPKVRWTRTPSSGTSSPEKTTAATV